MEVRFHPHAKERMKERGASEAEVIVTVQAGERFPAKFGRTGFRHNFPFDSEWRGNYYKTKQVEAFALEEGIDWLVITIITHYF
jgi:hypothetical protein